MPDKPLTSDKILTILTATPPRIAELITDLPPARLHAAPSSGEWSANDVLAHLRACADVWGNSIALILGQDMPTIRAVSPRTWIHKTDYPEQEFQSSLRAFTTQREDLLAVLRPLSPGEWARIALVTGVGKPFERTVLNFAERMAVHERSHVRQIERIVSALCP